MSLLAKQLIERSCFLPALASTTRTGALGELTPGLGDAVIHPAEFFAEVEAREAMQSTDTGRGIAFPHARSESVKRLALSVGRSAKGIRFRDSQPPVHLIFLLGIPPAEIPAYLECVAWLVRTLREAGVYDRLLRAESEEALRAVFLGMEGKT